jgi:uncharacterized protein (DUF433 family)
MVEGKGFDRRDEKNPDKSDTSEPQQAAPPGLPCPPASTPSGPPASSDETTDERQGAGSGGQDRPGILVPAPRGGAMTKLSDIVHSDPEILGGTPVFVGTRVPVQSLFDYLEGGETLDEFLRQFPSVRRDQAIAALDLARATLLAGARSS